MIRNEINSNLSFETCTLKRSSRYPARRRIRPRHCRKHLFGLHGELDWDPSPWKSCTLLHDNIYKQYNGKVCVFEDSVLCLSGKFPQCSKSTEVWYKTELGSSSQLQSVVICATLTVSRSCTATQLLQEVQIHQQNSEDRITFVSMCNDIDWTTKANGNLGVENSTRVCEYAIKFATGDWFFFGQRHMNKWYGTISLLQTKQRMELNSRNGDADICRVSASGVVRDNSFVPRIVEMQRRENVSIDFKAELQTAELFFARRMQSISSVCLEQ